MKRRIIQNNMTAIAFWDSGFSISFERNIQLWLPIWCVYVIKIVEIVSKIFYVFLPLSFEVTHLKKGKKEMVTVASLSGESQWQNIFFDIGFYFSRENPRNCNFSFVCDKIINTSRFVILYGVFKKSPTTLRKYWVKKIWPKLELQNFVRAI